MSLIPVFSPKLPVAEQILPYLQKIDVNRWYSNFGPLHHEFINRIAQLLGIGSSHVVGGNTGTQLLELTLKACGIEQGSLCIMPSWTFVATPLAAISAQLEPLFIDVDLKTQAIDPEQLLDDLPYIKKLGKVGAVIVTAPFGSPVNTKAWKKFKESTGIPVVIDAAAGFDAVLQGLGMEVSDIPMMISLHATKILGIGEGGIVLSSDEQLIKKISSLTQYGFAHGERRSYMFGTNVKMSEYASAIGLAALDNWQETRLAWKKISDYYLKVLKRHNILTWLSEKWLATTCNIIVPEGADLLSSRLEKNNVMTRKWWGEGCHPQPAFKKIQSLFPLKNTNYLAKSVIGLPYYLDLSNPLIDKICQCMKAEEAVFA